MLGIQLCHLDELTALIEHVSAEIERRLQPLAPLVAELVTVPTVGRQTAETVLARSVPT